MAVGQIIYNVEDYAGSGGLLSTSRKDKRVILNSFLDNNYESNKIDPYDNLFADEKGPIIKIGIQAPPGTKFYLLENSDPLMIGRSGIYEINEEGYQINYLKFQRPIDYFLDIQKSEEKVGESISQMEEAYKKYESQYNALKLLKDSPTNSMSNEIFWENYNQIYDQYYNDYTSARKTYLEGLNGVYQEGMPSDLYNIIIDYVVREK